MADPALSPRFKEGDLVRVDTREHSGHYRTPSYVKGKTGRVVRLWGAFPNPEELAYGKPGLPAAPLYDVEFNQADLWPRYAGSPADKLHMDIYDHWLEHALEERR